MVPLDARGESVESGRFESHSPGSATVAFLPAESVLETSTEAGGCSRKIDADAASLCLAGARLREGGTSTTGHPPRPSGVLGSRGDTVLGARPGRSYAGCTPHVKAGLRVLSARLASAAQRVLSPGSGCGRGDAAARQLGGPFTVRERAQTDESAYSSSAPSLHVPSLTIRIVALALARRRAQPEHARGRRRRTRPTLIRQSTTELPVRQARGVRVTPVRLRRCAQRQSELLDDPAAIDSPVSLGVSSPVRRTLRRWRRRRRERGSWRAASGGRSSGAESRVARAAAPSRRR